MIDHLFSVLQMRLEAYDAVFWQIRLPLQNASVNGDQLWDAAEKLVKTYPEDLNASLTEEIVHFQHYMNESESDVCLS